MAALWQQIASHVRLKGIHIASVNQKAPANAELPSNNKVVRILRLFDKEIPLSGRA